MRFSVQREVLLKPLSQVVGVVERRQTLPVLANLLVSVSAEGVSFTGTDLEVEMVARMAADQLDPGEITIPARKLFDICRALPDGIKIDFKPERRTRDHEAGRSRFTLSTLPAAEFPQVDDIDLLERVTLPEATLKELIDRTAFAMAHQDVRYYLNGTLLDLREQALRCVATDGHRLALCETGIELNAKARTPDHHSAQGRAGAAAPARSRRRHGRDRIRAQPPARAPRAISSSPPSSSTAVSRTTRR